MHPVRSRIQAYSERNRFACLAIASVLAGLFGCAGLTDSSEGSAPSSAQLPPSPVSPLPQVSRDAIRQPGQVVSSYDPAADHTSVAFLARVATVPDLYLYAFTAFVGRQPVSAAADVFLGVVSFAPAQLFGASKTVSLSIEGDTLECLGAWAVEELDTGRRFEWLLFNRTFNQAGLLNITTARSVTVDIRGSVSFELAAEHRALLRDLSARIVP